MAFCAQCGSETQGSFCPACGASGGGAPSATAVPAGGRSALDDHIVNALCYLAWPLTGVLFLVLEPYNKNKNIRFHAFQSILVFAALFAGSVALSFLAFMPFVKLIFTLITLVYPVFAFGIWVLLMFKAFNKERFEVPVLGAIAKSQA